MANSNGKIHPSDQMTSRERLLAAYRGDEVDRLPYWAKVANPTWRRSQPDSVQAWSTRELLDHIHADGIFHVPAAVTITRPHIRTEARRNGAVETRVTHTPDGDLTERWTLDPGTQSWHPTEFPVKTVGDLRLLRWKYADVQIEPNPDAAARGLQAKADIGERGIHLTGWGTSPLMNLVEHIIGPVNTHLMLHDHPDEMNELIALMHADCLPRAQAIARHTPAADTVVSVENTSTTLISPAQFTTYCHRHLCDYGRAIEAEGKMHELHMCGLTRALLPQIDTIPATSIEAYTSPTLGNTRLCHGRTAAPSKTLVGGTNVNVWLWPLDTIKRYIVEELAACPDRRRIVVTTAGVAPPGCTAGTFRAIGQWIPTLAAG